MAVAAPGKQGTAPTETGELSHLVCGVFCGAAHAELVHVCLANQHSTRGPQLGDGCGVKGGQVAVQHPAAGGGAQTGGTDVVLQQHEDQPQ